jgi:hypothetical protein
MQQQKQQSEAQRQSKAQRRSDAQRSDAHGQEAQKKECEAQQQP